MGVDYSPMIVIGFTEEEFISKVLRGGQRKLYQKDPEEYLENRHPDLSRNHEDCWASETTVYVGVVAYEGESSRSGGANGSSVDLTDALIEAREKFIKSIGRDIKPKTFSYTHVW